MPNLKNPKNLSEIILASMASGKVNEYSDFVDKIKVRDHFDEWGLSEYLPKLYGVWDNVDDIEFDKLPNAFALKTNHGCGHHYFCRDKSQVNVEEAKRIIKDALNTNFGKSAETQYNSIRPRVFGEEFLDDGTGVLPSDYKFHYVDGNLKCILVVTERTNNSYKLLTYDSQWNKLDYIKPEYKTDHVFKEPNNLNLMLEISKKIAQSFEFVRVDFYDLGDRVVIGELTFTPQGGIMSYYTDEAIEKMGRGALL